MVRRILAWLLTLHALHVPIPFPDLDGECRGAPIVSLSDLNAWNVLLIGVRPNDDIDRGPIRNRRDPGSDLPSDSPFGDPPVLSTGSFTAARILYSSDVAIARDFRFKDRSSGWTSCGVIQSDPSSAVRSARTTCVCQCSWQV